MKDKELREQVKHLKEAILLISEHLGWGLDIYDFMKPSLYEYLGGNKDKRPIRKADLIPIQTYADNFKLLLDHLGLEIFEGKELRKKKISPKES